mgnify:CR=1 FL=1
MTAAPPPPSPPAPLPLWRRLARLPLIPMALCLLCGAGILQNIYHMGMNVYRSVTWSGELQQVKAENAHLRQDIRILNDAKVQLNNPAYMEELARCWGYVSQNERVLVVQDAPAVIGSNCDEYRLP